MTIDSPPTHCNPDRRRWMAAAGGAVVGLAAGILPVQAALAKTGGEQMDVTATEDLMREHGILRRALLVYAEVASRLRQDEADVRADALGSTARLFRRFGEEYHERSLEEVHVFPPLIKRGGEHANLSKTWIVQHARAREITDYILAVTRSGRVGPADREPLAQTLSGFVRMYQHHAAIEDTIIFPAWKAAISADQYRESTEQFEELERRLFGDDGFDDALAQVAAVERAVGLAELGTLTAPAPPQYPITEVPLSPKNTNPGDSVDE